MSYSFDKWLDDEQRRNEREQIEREQEYNEAVRYLAEEKEREAKEAQERLYHEEYMSWCGKSADETWAERCQLVERERELLDQLSSQRMQIQSEFLSQQKSKNKTRWIAVIVIFLVVLVCLRITDNWIVVDSILEIIYEILKWFFNAIKGIIEFFWGFFKK